MQTKVSNKLNVKKCLEGFISQKDIEKIKNRLIEYEGPGMYSLNDNIYKKGVFPTYSRIAIK